MKEKLLAFIIFLGLSIVIFPIALYAVAQGSLPWIPILPVINFCQLVWASIYAMAISLVIFITFYALKNLIRKKTQECS